MIVEWGYNLYDACGRYSHDPRIGLFFGILQKEVWLPLYTLTTSIHILHTALYTFSKVQTRRI